MLLQNESGHSYVQTTLTCFSSDYVRVPKHWRVRKQLYQILVRWAFRY